MMKNICLMILVLCILPLYCITPLSAQNTADCFRLYLSDKNGSPYSVNNPQEFLSDRAIAKRTRFHIAVTEEDLPVNPNYVDTILNKGTEIRLLSSSKWFNTITVYCPDTTSFRQIQALPFIDSVLPVASYKGWFDFFEEQKNMFSDFSEENYGYGEMYLALHNGEELHSAGYRGENMLIAVIDAGWNGFDTLSFFNSLYQRGGVMGTKDLIPFLDNVYAYHPHGTMVTSVMCAYKEGEMIGTAPEADYFFIRSENPLDEQLIEEDFWVQAAEIADSIGADVINSSLGYTTFPDFSSSIWTYEQCDGISSIASLAATKAGEKGIIVCVAVGNEGNTSWQYLARPSDAMNILAVGAISRDTIPADFTSHGPSFDGRVKPDVVSLGTYAPVVGTDGNLLLSHGTSLAAPAIAGLAACLWQALAEKDASEIMQIIRESAHQYQTPNALMGYGIPDFYKAYLDHTGGIGFPEYDTKQYNIIAFPNPCQDQFQVLNFDNEITSIYLFDIQGRMIKNISTFEQPLISVDIRTLKPGTYIGKAILKNGTAPFKMVKTE